MMLSLVQLRAYGFDPQPRGAIGFAVARLDETAFAQALKDAKGAVRQNVPLARVAGDTADLAVFTAFMMDAAAKGELVQHALLVF